MNEYEDNVIVRMIDKKIFDKMNDAYLKNNWQEVERIKNIFAKNDGVQAFYIKFCLYEGKYEEIEQLGAKFPNSEQVQYKVIKLYEIQEQYSKAREICRRFPKSPLMQSKLMSIALKQKSVCEAREIGRRQCFRDESKIQEQLIKVYLIDKKYDKIDEIDSRFPNKLSVKLEKINALIAQGKIEQAKAICELHQDEIMFQSRLINIKLDEKDYEGAKEIGKRFKGDPPMQSQMLRIAIAEKDDNTITQIGSNFPNYYIIQSQMIKWAVQIGKREAAKNIGKRFKNIAVLQSQMVSIAVREHDEETINEIAKRFPESMIIQEQANRYFHYKKIEKLNSKNEKSNTEGEYIKSHKEDEKKARQEFLNRQKTYIYEEKIDDDFFENVITNTSLNDWDRMLVLIAACEKTGNSKLMKSIIEQYKKENEDVSKERKKVLNELKQRSNGKTQKVFGWQLYDESLRWKLDEELINELEKAKAETSKNKFLIDLKCTVPGTGKKGMEKVTRVIEQEQVHENH